MSRIKKIIGRIICSIKEEHLLMLGTDINTTIDGWQKQFDAGAEKIPCYCGRCGQLFLFIIPQEGDNTDEQT